MADSPKRVQMSRQKPWRALNRDAVIVARPSKWGNPFSVAEFGYHAAVDKYRVWVEGRIADGLLDVAELRGKDLACWCKVVLDDLRLERPTCHADVLLKLANA